MILTYWWDLWCWIFKIPSILKCKINLTKKENTHNEVHRSWQWKSNCFQDKINHLKIAHEQSNSQRTNKNVCAAWLGKNCWALERFVILMFLSKFVTLELHASSFPLTSNRCLFCVYTREIWVYFCNLLLYLAQYESCIKFLERRGLWRSLICLCHCKQCLL